CLLLCVGALRCLTTATLGVFGWLQITHINLRLIFLLFAHNYLSWFVSCFFGFGLCQSRRNTCRRQRPFRLGLGRPNGSAYLSNASAVELHAPQNLRPFFPSTNSHSPYYHYLCHEIFWFQFLPQFAVSNRYLMPCSTASYIPNAIN